MATYSATVDISWSGASGSPGANVWHYRSVGSGPSETDDQFVAAAQQLLNVYRDGWLQYAPTTVTCSFDGVWQKTDGSGDQRSVSGSSWSYSGYGSTTDFLPTANNLLANFRCASGGRKGRGRKFFGPLRPSASEGNGTPDEGVRSNLQSKLNALIAWNGSANNGAFGVLSRRDNLFRDFTSVDVPNEFGILRSRRD